MLENNDPKQLLKAGLIQQQWSRLDPDLAMHVALSALSLNLTTVFKTVQLMAHLQMMRIMDSDIKATKQQRDEFEYASQELLPQTYLDRNDKPQ